MSNSLVVLISCMHQQDNSIVERTNVQTDAVVVNQCDINSIKEYKFYNKKGRLCNVCFINTTERGLSRSRNMAIKYANADICLICDDDEVLEDNYENIILNAHQKYSTKGIIAFSLIRKDINKTYPTQEGPISFRRIFSTNSLQLTFKLGLINKYNIRFDEKMGSGTGNGGGEENKFLMDCRYHSIKLYYCPIIIATVNPNLEGSKWFNGFNEKYFIDTGWSSKRIFNPILSLFYIIYVLIFKHKFYKDKMSTIQVLRAMLKGWCENR